MSCVGELHRCLHVAETLVMGLKRWWWGGTHHQRRASEWTPDHSVVKAWSMRVRCSLRWMLC